MLQGYFTKIKEKHVVNVAMSDCQQFVNETRAFVSHQNCNSEFVAVVVGGKLLHA